MFSKLNTCQWTGRPFCSVFLVNLILLIFLSVSTAQVSTNITPDNTLGTQITQNDRTFNINGGARPENGPNLFHSFNQFIVGTGDTANFASNSGVENIIGRVTGGAESMIDGTLQATANLFLLNPNGIVFGSNATLKVNASFHVSTANVIQFDDGTTFSASANLTEQSGLTSSPPSSFGFLDRKPEGITIRQGNDPSKHLSVGEGATFSVTGGNINLTGRRIAAPGGRIYLTSVASDGNVQIDIGDNASRLVEDRPPRLGSVRIGEGSQVDVSGSTGGVILVESQTTQVANGALLLNGTIDGQSGDIVLKTGDLTLDTNSFIISYTVPGSPGNAGNVLVDAEGTVAIRNGSAVTSSTQGNGQSGSVRVTADTLLIDGAGALGPSQLSTTVALGAQGDGDAKDLSVNAETLTITNGGAISSSSFGVGNGGNVLVDVHKEVTLEGYGNTAMGIRPSLIGTSTQPGSTGHAGNTVVMSQVITVKDGAQIQSGTTGLGNGGSVTVTARESITLDGFGGGFLSLITANSDERAIGNAGTVEVSAPRIIATNGAQISSVTFGEGLGGNVTVTADDSIIFTGTAPGEAVSQGELIPGDETFPSGAFVNSHGSGGPGVVQVIAPRIMLTDGGRISSLNIISENQGGEVTVNASDLLSISDVGSGLRTQSLGPGQGGDIEVTAGMLTVINGADISASSIREPNSSSKRSGDAGDIAVTVSNGFDLESSRVSTEAPEANGGDIHIIAVNTPVRISDSTVTTRVNQQSGVGGNVTIEADPIILDRSEISTSAGPGTGGDITINGAFVFDGTYVSGQTCTGNTAISCLDASGQVSGNIDEGSPVDTSGTTSPLPQGFAQVSNLLRQQCAERLQGGRSSSLVLTGRAGVPVELGGMLPSIMPTEPLPIFDAADTQHGEDRLDQLAKLAQTQEAAGHYAQAVSTLHTMTKLAEESGNKTQLAMSLGSLGNAYIAVGPSDKAELYLQQGIELAETIGQTALAARIQNDRGNLLAFQQKYLDAQVAYIQSGQRALETEEHGLAARALTNAALAAIQDENYQQETQDWLDQAWMQLRPQNPTLAKAHTLVSLGVGYSQLHEHLPDSPMAHMERAMSALTEAGDIADGLNDWRAASYAWGHLGRLHMTEGQYSQALQWTRRAALAAQQANAPESLYRWQWQTGRLFKQLDQLDAAIAAYQRAVTTLESFRHELLVTYARAEGIHQSIRPVYSEFVDLTLKHTASMQDHDQRRKALLAARDAVESFKVSELQDYFQDECIQAFQAKKQSLEEWTTAGVAIIYPILLPDRLELLVSTSSGVERFSAPVDAETLTQEVLTFRGLLESSTTRGYRQHARRLYDWLVRPFETILTPEIKTLVFVPDGALRSIPLATLHDGKQYLIERYAVAITLGLDLIEPRPLPKSDIRGRVLAAGLTEGVQNFSSLPSVRDELDFLKAQYASKTLLNETFRASIVNQTIKEEPFTIVHLATHAQFAGEVDDTFLLTYDGKLNMDELHAMIAQARFRDEPIELLTLSACQTAVGDDRAILGLAGVALRAGARSALATLWFIDDAATAQLISEFYQQLKVPDTSRAEALRQAQLKLLKDRQYRHPFFWAAFQMLNTWL